MIVVQLIEECEIRIGEKTEDVLKKDTFYIMSGELYFKMQALAPQALGVTIPFKEIYNPYKGQDLNNKKVLAMRHGGFGDILFLSTGLRELQAKYPEAKLDVAIGGLYFDAVKNAPYINKVMSLPLELDVWNQYHYHFQFEGIIENNPDASSYNAYDLFMQRMGLDIKKVEAYNKIPKLYFTKDEYVTVSEQFLSLKEQRKKVGIQVASSSPIRTYPIHNWVPIIEHLKQEGYDVYLFGSGNQTTPIKYIKQQCGDHIYEVVEDLRTAMVLATYMDAIIAPDSMFVHIAGALRKPLLGIYGPFPSELRMKYFNRCIGIDAQTACSPCFKHGQNPCPKGDPPPCFSLIKPSIVCDAFDKLMQMTS